MIFFFGTKVIQRELPTEQKVCPNCLSVTAHAVVEQDTRFTLYFIPLFSIKRDINYTCTVCGDTYIIPYSEYAAAHSASADMKETANRATSASGASRGDKARVILEGKIVNGEVKTSGPRPVNYASDQILKWMWIAFGVILLLAASIITIIYVAISR
ncbi:MAG TPA: zinc-ribbon domain-containing protein [Anaerolineales bacterium]|nr:zinc-ribbon domain-containing protein [Anaerolineales bacterium]